MTAPAPPPPNYPGSQGKRRWKTATIAILAGVVLLALAGGATALVISSKGHSGSTLPTSAAVTTPDTGTTASTDPGTTADPVAPATTDTTPTPPAPTPAADVLAAINQHWLDIKNGDYHAAFQLLLPSADGDSTESTWVASHNQDGITNVNYHFTVAWVNRNLARVNADTLTTQDATGCHTFSGHYLMSQQSGSWLIAQVFLAVDGC